MLFGNLVNVSDAARPQPMGGRNRRLMHFVHKMHNRRACFFVATCFPKTIYCDFVRGAFFREYECIGTGYWPRHQLRIINKSSKVLG
jgi:hypothetical protein